MKTEIKKSLGIFSATLGLVVAWGLLVMGAAGPPAILRNPLTTNQVVIGSGLALSGSTLSNTMTSNSFTTNALAIGDGLTNSSGTLSNTFYPYGPANSVQIKGTNQFYGDTNFTYTNSSVGIGTNNPSHTLHIVTHTNNAFGVDSDGTDSASMAHIRNMGVQGPFFDFEGAGGRWGWGVSAAGNLDLRLGNAGTDPVNGTTFFHATPTGEFQGYGPYSSMIGPTYPTNLVTLGYISGLTNFIAQGGTLQTNWLNNGTNVWYNGDVGILTNAPRAHLDVNTPNATVAVLGNSLTVNHQIRFGSTAGCYITGGNDTIQLLDTSNHGAKITATGLELYGNRLTFGTSVDVILRAAGTGDTTYSGNAGQIIMAPIGGTMFVTNANVNVTNGYVFWQGRAITTSDFGFTNTTLIAIPGLTALVAASGTYAFEGLLYYSCGFTNDGTQIAPVTNGLNFAVSGTSSATHIIGHMDATDDYSASKLLTYRFTALGSTNGFIGSTNGLVSIVGTIKVNGPGTLLLQVAQAYGCGDVNTNKIMQGSYFFVR